MKRVIFFTVMIIGVITMSHITVHAQMRAYSINIDKNQDPDSIYIMISDTVPSKYRYGKFKSVNYLDWLQSVGVGVCQHLSCDDNNAYLYVPSDITINAGADILIGSNTGDIDIIGSQAIHMETPADVTIEGGDVTFDADTDVTLLSGANINLSADGGNDFISFSGHPTGSIESGVYLPVRSAESNTATVVPDSAVWSRVGNTVTVSGSFSSDPTLDSTATSFEFDLPVATNVLATYDVSGVSAIQSTSAAIGGSPGAIYGSVANNTAVVHWYTTADVASKKWSYTLTYRIR